MSEFTKYIIRTKTISRRQAVKERLCGVAQGVRYGFREVIEQLSFLFKPLYRTVEYQEPVEPGHPDYDKASFHFSAQHYAGEITWINNVDLK